MAVIESPKAGGYDFERRQVIRLPKTGIYGGMLAAYSIPKEYQTKWGPKEQFVLRFVVTHDQAYRQLPAFSGAFVKVTNVISEKSNLVGALYALLGGKKSKEDIISGDGLYDYDDFIARPVELFIRPGDKPDSDGIFANFVTSMEPANKDLIAAIKPLYAAKVIQTNEKTGVKYLASPAEQYEEAIAAAEEASKPFSDDDFAGLDDEDLPF